MGRIFHEVSGTIIVPVLVYLYLFVFFYVWSTARLVCLFVVCSELI